MNFSSRSLLSRRAGAVLAGLLVAGSVASCSTGGATRIAASTDKDDLVMVTEVRSLSNPYAAAWVKGSQAYADSVGIPLKTIVYGGDSQNALSQLQSILAAGKTVLLNIDPNTSADTPAIVRAVQNSGGCAVTQWSKPAGLHPWDVGDGWAAFVTYNGVEQGQGAADVLADSLGGEGGIIALQGILSNEVSQTRDQGLAASLAEHSGIKLLDQQPADFDRNKAYNTIQTLLNKYGKDVNGVWAANDAMALGAIQAIREAGRAGEIKVVSASDATPEGLEDIDNGDMLATFTTDPYYNGAMPLALCYQAVTGKVNISELPHDKREFYVEHSLVTKDNVDQYLREPSAAEIAASVEDPYGRISGPLTK
ncbi:ribose transport system substrate-binding protein [Rhodococcus sp. 27YEA15]|uniref:sugar ABC transporter substrate-binding protein n=1 Tax=Rhodococcus sp. 27YEA15 TaxID=3156259 RepID=UPI003C7B4F02